MTVCLENFSYNILIANLHEMQNFLIKEINNKYTKKTLIDNFSKILITMIPIVPHLASECLKLLQITKVSWPKFDENLNEQNNYQDCAAFFAEMLKAKRVKTM